MVRKSQQSDQQSAVLTRAPVDETIVVGTVDGATVDNSSTTGCGCEFKRWKMQRIADSCDSLVHLGRPS